MPEEKVSQLDSILDYCAHCGVPRHIHEYPNATFSHGFLSKKMCDTLPPAADAGPRQPCPHVNTMGHEWESHCVDCGEVWKHATPDYSVTTTAPPVPQEAAPRCKEDQELVDAGFAENPEEVEATAPDWAMRVAQQCVRLANGYASDAGILDSDELTVGMAALIHQAGSDEIAKVKQELADLRAQRYENMDEFRFRGKTAAELTELIARGQAGGERAVVERCAQWLEQESGIFDHPGVRQNGATLRIAAKGLRAEASRLLGGESK